MIRPRSSASSSRISAARKSHPALSAKVVFLYSRKVSAASWSFLSISSSPKASNVSSSSPVAGFTVDIATAVLLERSAPTSRKYIYPLEPHLPRARGPAAVQSGGPMKRDLAKTIGPAEARRLLEERARAAGFDLVGVARAEAPRGGGQRPPRGAGGGG